MNSKIRILKFTLGEERLKENIDISEHLETKLGAVCQGFYIATTTAELIRVIDLCRELKVSYLLFGSGSKMAIVVDGFDGLAIKNRSDNLKISGIKGKVSRTGIGIEEALIEADSGVSLKRLAEYAAEHNLGGFESLRSALGTVGGSLSLNKTLREKTHQVSVYTKSGIKKNKQLEQLIRDDIVLSVIFKLNARKNY